MIVVDASVLANVVGDDESAGVLARRRLQDAGAASAPDVVDVETVSVLRRRWLKGDLNDERFRDAVDDLLALPIASGLPPAVEVEICTTTVIAR